MSPKEWPAALSVQSGYAGGLGPQNISDQLKLMASPSQGKAVWVDMESSLRSTVEEKDIFDLGKVQVVIDKVLAVESHS